MRDTCPYIGRIEYRLKLSLYSIFSFPRPAACFGLSFSARSFQNSPATWPVAAHGDSPIRNQIQISSYVKDVGHFLLGISLKGVPKCCCGAGRFARHQPRYWRVHRRDGCGPKSRDNNANKTLFCQGKHFFFCQSRKKYGRPDFHGFHQPLDKEPQRKKMCAFRCNVFDPCPPPPLSLSLHTSFPTSRELETWNRRNSTFTRNFLLFREFDELRPDTSESNGVGVKSGRHPPTCCIDGSQHFLPAVAFPNDDRVSITWEGCQATIKREKR